MLKSLTPVRPLALSLLVSGLAVLGVAAGPAPSASAVVTTPAKVISVQRATATGAFLTADGDVYTWGDNGVGGTGLGLTSGRTTLPTKLPDFAPTGETVVQIALSGLAYGTGSKVFGLARTDAGTVYSWGYDGDGGLGNGATLASTSTPGLVTAAWGSDKPVLIAIAGIGGRVVTESGHVWAWGDNEWGQTGVDNGGADIGAPVEVTSLYRPSDKVVQIVGGTSSMTVRTEAGTVLSAGSKARGRRGDGTSDPNNFNTYTPALGQLSFSGLPAGDQIVSIDSGASHTLAVSGTGKVWGWGLSTGGRLGADLGNADQLVPVAVSPSMVDAGDQPASVKIGATGNSSYLLTAQGNLYSAGSANNGVLANGATTGSSTVFGKVTSWPSRGANDPLVDLSAGGGAVNAVTQSGLVYTWGNPAANGDVGAGPGIGLADTTTVRSTPVLMADAQVLSPFTDAVDASVSGTVSVGTSLTGSAGTYAPSDAAIGYAWKVGSTTVGTTSSYTPKLADAGKTLTLTVTGTKSGYADSTSTTTGQTVATVQGFTGTVKAGQTLTASDASGTNTWGLSASSSCASPTTSTGTTYALPGDSAGKYVQLSQTLSGRTGSGTCVGPIAAATSAPTITGAATASGVKGASFSYTPTSVGGQPAPTVTVVGTLPTGVTVAGSTGVLSGTPSVAGSFPVTLKADNGVGTAATLGVTITIDDVVTGLSPAISGTPKVGVQLTASPGGSLSPGGGDGATVVYLWQYESAPGTWSDLTAGATYTPGTSEVGRVYRVKVTVSKTGFQTRTDYSSATAAAVKGTFSIGAPTMSGTAKVGQTLTCAAAVGTPGTISYAWSRGVTSLGSGATYDLVAADRNNVVTCTVTSVRTGYDDATNAADSDTVDYGTFTIGAPSITGTEKVGQTLTCAAAGGTPGTVTYSWTRDSTVLGYGAAYELTSADRTHMVTCRVLAQRVGYSNATNSKDSATIDYGTFTIGAPTITGTAAVGQTLTCAAAGGTPGALSYAWTRGVTSLGSGTTYELTPDDRTHVVTCAITSVRAGYTDAVNTKDSGTIGAGTFTIGTPSVTGTAVVGEILTCAAAPGTVGAVSYAWTRGVTALGSGDTYELVAADRTHEVTCTVTSERAGYGDATSSADSDTVDYGTFTIGAPSISGTAEVGETLTCAAAPGTPGTVSYAWSRGVTSLGSGATYDLVAADRTNTVTCTVTSVRAGYTDATNEVDSDPVDYGTFTIDAPSITGTAEVGRTLTCVPAQGTVGAVSYAWTRGVTALGSAETYDLVAADRTEEVTCTVTSVRAGYTDASNSKDSETVDYGTFTIGAPAISGTAVVGETLTCAAAGGSPGTLSYAWSRGVTALGGGSTYELTPDDRTHVVTCTVTSVRAGYTDATNTKDSATVGAGSFSIGVPSITGTAAVGETLTCAAAVGTVGTVSYAWTRGQTSLGSGSTYELVAADRTHEVTCTVTSERAGYTDATNEADSDTIGNGSFAIGAPSITGTAVVGETLTCAAAAGTPGTVSYAWTRGATSLGSGATYELASDDRTHVVTCTVTAEQAGYTDATNEVDSDTVDYGTFTIEAPSITGTAEVGQTLTCVPAQGTVGALSYAWTRGVTALGSDATYELTPDDRTHVVTCTVTSERAGYTDAINEADSDPVDYGTFSIGVPSITGIVEVGRTLTCAPAQGTVGAASYEWTRGATTLGSGDSYELTADDRTHEVTCTVTSVRDGYTDATNSADSQTVDFGSFTFDAPTVTGTAKVGETLTCAVPAGTPGTVSYAWTRGQVSLGDGPSYELTPADRTHEVTCAAISERAGYHDATNSADSQMVDFGTFVVGALVVSGEAKVGQTLGCAVPPGTPGAASYAWSRGSTPLGTGPSYVLVPADLSQVVTCAVVVVRDGYRDATASAGSVAVQPGAAASYRVSVTGTAKVGSTLHARVVDELPAGASVRWQWLRGDSPIAGASGAGHKLVGRDFGQRVSAVATIQVPGYEDATASDASTARVGVQRMRLTVNKSRFLVGSPVRITVTELLPGERWTLEFGNGRFIASGRAPAAGGRMVRTVRLPAGARFVENERHVELQTTAPHRVAWAHFTLKLR